MLQNQETVIGEDSSQWAQSVLLSVGRSVVWLVCHDFLKVREVSLTMLLSEHLFQMLSLYTYFVSRSNWFSCRDYWLPIWLLTKPLGLYSIVISPFSLQSIPYTTSFWGFIGYRVLCLDLEQFSNFSCSFFKLKVNSSHRILALDLVIAGLLDLIVMKWWGGGAGDEMH